MLSLFPGIGLLDRAFEEQGFVVVRGPDRLWGGDVRRFHPPRGVFAGIIGGPPCQRFSTAAALAPASLHEDLIPEFLRCIEEAAPAWVVMENVTAAIGHPDIPDEWFPCILRDSDCGGLTSRRRAFWTWPFAVMQPSPNGIRGERSVMASTWKRGAGQYVDDKGFLPGNLPIREYGRLQGADEIAEALEEHHASRAFAVTVLGNGVPLAMGRYIARATAQAVNG